MRSTLPRVKQLQADLARCNREIAAIDATKDGQPAYLCTLGREDWLREKQVIEQELSLYAD